MAKAEARRLPGRPKSDCKRAGILEAARRLFVDHAYEQVTMEQVARGAGVAKMTLYSHFADKESLFEAMVRSTSDQLTAALPDLPGSVGDAEAQLNAFGQGLLRLFLSPVFLGTMHRQFAVLTRNRTLAERVYNAGPGQTRSALAAYLTATFGAARMSRERSAEAASDLLSLWLSDTQQRLALGLMSEPTADEIAERVRRCTKLLLHAYDLSLEDHAAGAPRNQDVPRS